MNDQDATILERELPSDLTDQFAAVGAAVGLERAPKTMGEWVELTTSTLDDADVPTGLEAMCTADRDRHEATFGDRTRRFHCVLDTLLVPFVVDSDEPVEVHSESPQSGETIEIQVSREELAVSPETAVMSFGLATDFGEITGDQIDPTVGYELFCPYVNAFVSREEYERWADETDEAITIGLSVSEGYELAHALEGSPTGPSDSS